ncbi:hypothetical protein SPF06_16685 [Sinomonas sp. JGH33]|uniref:Uncharacterized protein n=1 Tax=Sinomonas terricola TaxID=3110330 RepID=A0ABU5TA19_9MICC|nr:hypothetical protein [Sinomonas sp. JGH33]MEA5456372.1 hypothetical protein [Sinomonas sp. JGH33]
MAPSRFLPLRRSARATLWCTLAAAILLALTAWTLEEWLGALALAALAAFVLSALYAILGMGRYWFAAAAALGTALTIGCSLAFLRVLGVAWDDAPNTVTSVSSRDADPYFAGAVVALVATLGILFAGAVWPRRRQAARRPGPAKPSRPAPSGTRRPPRPTATATRSSAGARASAPRPAAPRNR